jgi:hypothetical protein
VAEETSERSWLAAVRPQAGWLPRASVGLGIAATVAMNVAAGSRGGPGGALVGTLTPVGFVVSLETLIFLVRKLARLPWGWAWCTGTGIPLAGLAGITGVISYLHALTVAQWTGDPAEAGLSLTEHLLPLVADLMILTGSVALVALAVAGKHRLADRKTPAGAGREVSGATRDRPPREGPAPRQPADRKTARRKQPASHLAPPGVPEQVVRDALLAGNLTQRTLQAAVAGAGYPQFTRWQAGKALKVTGANGHGPAKED